MPIYLYRCAQSHTTERIRHYDQRDDLVKCRCGRDTERVEIARTHSPPDGVYSYAPNVGSADRFDRQREALKSGTKVIPRVPPMDPRARDGQYSSRERE